VTPAVLDNSSGESIRLAVMSVTIEQMPEGHTKLAAGPVKDLDLAPKTGIGDPQCRIVVHQTLPLNSGKHEGQTLLGAAWIPKRIEPASQGTQSPQRMDGG